MYPRMASLCAVDAINGVTVTARPPTGNPHLRSARVGIDDASQARNGDLGHVDACIVDDESWVLRSLVVDTRTWWPGTHVLVSPPWITSVRWTQSRVVVDRLRETIKARSEYDPSHAAQSGGRDQAPRGSPTRAILGGDA